MRVTEKHMFEVFGVKVNAAYYCDVLLLQQLLPDICQAAGDFYFSERHACTRALSCYDTRLQTSHQTCGFPSVATATSSSRLWPNHLILVILDFGIHIDADVSMRSHVMKTTSTCFAVLRQLQGIRRLVPRTVFQSLVLSLLLPRLD